MVAIIAGFTVPEVKEKYVIVFYASNFIIKQRFRYSLSSAINLMLVGTEKEVHACNCGILKDYRLIKTNVQ